MPFRHRQRQKETDPSNKDKLSYFEAEFIVNYEAYAYGFAVVLSTGIFVSEWLCKLSPTKEEYLFKKEDAQHSTGLPIIWTSTIRRTLFRLLLSWQTKKPFARHRNF